MFKSHKKYIHDIGKHKCSFCLQNRNSSISYKDDHGDHKICRKYYKRITGKGSRKEKEWSEFIDENFGTEYLSSNDKNLKSNGACTNYRPDKLYTGLDLVEINECDEKRISKIFENINSNTLES